ncbi:ABC transporter permease [Azospirillum thermophilum]|uniref:Peptide ABC transporter permease n=1 Tax=Azospirillum thermophilum TaxID=2202148 RepID=A0A2S2CYF9_9PROT|nr:ABC transporter permease [Azospirillum thermophilum]AWK89521.1 peptide ABC transporter permease [Azospirillum thermophilum]
MTGTWKHTVDPEPWSPDDEPPAASTLDPGASAGRLMFRRFLRHRLAVLAALFLGFSYLSLPFVDFLVPYGANERDVEHLYAPPQGVHLVHEGRFVGPFVYPTTAQPDLKSYRWRYTADTGRPMPLEFFCDGAPYRFLGLVEARLRLVCPPPGATLHLLGTDRLGRDILSRLAIGAKLSLTVGLLGIAVSFGIGITLGGIAGYFGGWADWTVQRVSEILKSLPELPLWLALSAAVPAHWSPVTVFLCISVILGLLDWPSLARAVRSRFLALREEDFVMAAELMGASPGRIIRRHLLPNFASHLLASATLSIPSMILGETALSFLGLGLRPPATSWGVMLNDAQNLMAVESYPWVLSPMLPVMLVVLSFNFLGDGLRDALDPYHHA